MEPAAFPTERAACRQSGGIQAQRCEGNIQRSLPASITTRPAVKAKS